MKQNPEISKLVSGTLKHDVRYIAKTISFVENSSYSEKKELLKAMYDYIGRAYVVGITGSPGTGKSTITDKLIQSFRNDSFTVAVLAIDPTSPFTHGALLGDRIRMQNHTLDPNVYIRSMASRGALGGLSTATKDAIKVLDAAGFDIIIVETVGIGQSEIDIVNVADSVLLVFAPGFGDEIQAMKAGVMEIADIYVINKADRDFSEKLFREISDMTNLSAKEPKPTVIKTIATNSLEKSNIIALKNEILKLKAFTISKNLLKEKRKRSIETELTDIIKATIIEKILSKQNTKAFFDKETMCKIYNKEINLYDAIDSILEVI